MSTFQVVRKASTRSVIVQIDGDAVPAGYTDIGSFVDADAHTLGEDPNVAFHYVRDILYDLGVQDVFNENIEFAPQSISVLPATVTLAVAATQQLDVTSDPVDSAGTITYGTSNAAKATVDAAGLITAVATGSATITATSSISGKTDTCVVTVS